MSGALRKRFLVGRRPVVVAGTHGKTTTSAMAAWLLWSAGYDPGWFVGGVPKSLAASAAIGSSHVRPNRGRSPFVVEGDEYDAVYWDKRPKFLDYIGIAQDDVAIITSVEHDHIDIYPDLASYEAAFRALARAVPESGLIVGDARDARVRGIVSTGRHNVRNAIAAFAACVEGFGMNVRDARAHLAAFEGVRRRQELLGEPRGVRVYDDFAHHPTAVDETLRALRERWPSGALWAVFEPRSATACRSLHQVAYARAFEAADRVVLAPLGRTNVPEGERLDIDRLARELGSKASAMGSVDAIVAHVSANARPGDCVAILSNGAFGGIHRKLLDSLAEPPAAGELTARPRLRRGVAGD